MCIVAVDAPSGSTDISLSSPHDDVERSSGKEKRQNAADERKEKSRDAARERRAKEFEYFQELEEVLPSAEMLVDTAKGAVDKTSLIRLTVAYLKSREVVKRDQPLLVKKEDEFELPDIDLLSCLDGFSLVLGAEGDIIYVSKNVSNYMGLKPVELLGQTMADYVHPCDLQDLASLTSPTGEGEVERAEVTIRMKCTVTERGRMVNLNQASYKPLRITGQTRGLASQDSGLSGALFIGTASPVSPMFSAPSQLGVFTTRHSLDMKFLEVDSWLTAVLGYPACSLLGESLFNLIHTADIQNVQAAFLKLKEHGMCSSVPYRLLACGGGFLWVQTRASCAPARRGSGKGQSITCQHFQITGLEEKETIMASVQMQKKITSLEGKVTNMASVPSRKEEEPRHLVEVQNANKHLVDIDTEPKAKLPTSLPTSVIVTSRPGPKAVTQSLFGKPREKSAEPSLAARDLPRVSTVKIFGADKVEPRTKPTVTTSRFFSPAVSQVEEPTALSSSAEQPLGSSDPARGKNDLEEEQKFFEMLFNFDTSDLEQLAPHNGVDCIDRKTRSSTSSASSCKDTTRDNIKSEDFNDLLGTGIDLAEIENFCETISDWSSPAETPPSSSGGSIEEEEFSDGWSPESKFDLAETPLLRPEEDIMWGSSCSQGGGGSEPRIIWGNVLQGEELGGESQMTEPPNYKRKEFPSEVDGERPKKVRVVENNTDFFFLVSGQ